jgi:hypothetical protein
MFESLRMVTVMVSGTEFSALVMGAHTLLPCQSTNKPWSGLPDC